MSTPGAGPPTVDRRSCRNSSRSRTEHRGNGSSTRCRRCRQRPRKRASRGLVCPAVGAACTALRSLRRQQPRRTHRPTSRMRSADPGFRWSWASPPNGPIDSDLAPVTAGGRRFRGWSSGTFAATAPLRSGAAGSTVPREIFARSSDLRHTPAAPRCDPSHRATPRFCTGPAGDPTLRSGTGEEPPTPGPAPLGPATSGRSGTPHQPRPPGCRPGARLPVPFGTRSRLRSEGRRRPTRGSSPPCTPLTREPAAGTLPAWERPLGRPIPGPSPASSRPQPDRRIPLVLTNRWWIPIVRLRTGSGCTGTADALRAHRGVMASREREIGQGLAPTMSPVADHRPRTAAGSAPARVPGAATRRSGPMTRVRWAIVWMCFLGTSINYLDRANVSIAMPKIVEEFHISHTLEGLALGAFFWTYALFQLPAGHLIDRFGARIMYTFAVVWWSVFTALTAVATSIGSLFGYRLGLGVGESAAYPANAKVVSMWFPAGNARSRPASTTAAPGSAAPRRCRWSPSW